LFFRIGAKLFFFPTSKKFAFIIQYFEIINQGSDSFYNCCVKEHITILIYSTSFKIKLESMKTFMFIGSIWLLASCGGWSKSQENVFIESCAKAANYDCDCSLKLTKEKYPNASDFNEKGSFDLELSKAILEKCSK
jgi:hypothetical protein